MSNQIIVQSFISFFIAILVFIHYRKRVTSQAERYSTFWPRFWSPSIDSVILWPIVVLTPLLLQQYIPALTTVISVIASYIFYIYSIYFHGRYGGTIGKLKCKIRVVDAVTEEPISYYQAFMRDAVPLLLMILLHFYGLIVSQGRLSDSRYAIYIPSILVLWFLAEIVTMLTNPKRRAIHDFIAGTVVIRPVSPLLG